MRSLSATRKLVLGLSAALLLLILGGYSAVFASIRSGVADTSGTAMARFPGDQVQALSAMVECETCNVRDRNRAVWALGQLRDRRALPAITRYRTGRPCDHAAGLCQHEIEKAIRAIESRSALWLGYRDLPWRTN